MATRLLCPWDFPGNSTGVDCHFLLQGIFPTQGSNLDLLHCRQDALHLSHQELQKVKVAQSCLTLCHPMHYTVRGILQAGILEWVAFPFPRGSSPTQGSNPGLPHCRRILYQLSHRGSPRTLDIWVKVLSLSNTYSYTHTHTGVHACSERAGGRLRKQRAPFPPAIVTEISAGAITSPD